MGLNFKDVPNSGTKTAMPEGWYTVKLANAELRPTKNGPDTMINAEFNIINPAKYAKRKVWNNFNLGPTSLWVLKGFLEAAGSNIAEQGNVDEAALVNALPGLVCDAYLEPDTSLNGDPRNKITNFKSSYSEEMEAASPAPATSGKTAMFK